MAESLSLKTWKRFVKEGVLDSTRINNKIMKSWHRSKDAEVDPYLTKSTVVLTKDQFHMQKEKNDLFLDIASPHLGRIRKVAKELRMVALLIDAKGYILSITGDKEVINNARKINFMEGARWTEKELGTNAIGTALQEREPIMVTGTEHYSIASHPWSCAAAPIRDDNGTLLGVIDFSCPANRTHPYMLGMVTSYAYTIERELSIRIHKDEKELLQNSLYLMESNQPILILNQHQEVVGASKTVRQQIPEWNKIDADSLRHYSFNSQMEVPIFSNTHGGFIGSYMYLLEGESEKTKSHAFSSDFVFKGETGTSAVFQRTLAELKQVAPTDANTYILGETGTGKEVIAQSIHENSSRKSGPFIAVNCGAIPKELMESELFGYVEGAFTGAKRKGYKGKFEQANHGTLFLDEIGEIPHSMQVALLRVLQERKVTPIGSNQEIPLNIRVITATHRDIRQLVYDGEFREDLYFRLYVYPIHVPPLRNRREDIPHFVRYFCTKNNWNVELSSEFFDRLMDYHWPGNIRELFNVLERLQILSQGAITDKTQMLNLLASLNIKKLESSPDMEQKEIEDSVQTSSLTFREKIQKDLMIKTLHKTQGNVSLAAKLLEVPRSTFYHRMQKFNL